MIEKFYLTVVTKKTTSKKEDSVVSMVELDDVSSDSMIQSWNGQYLDFSQQIEEVSLEEVKKAIGHYRISVCPYELPGWLNKWNITKVNQIEEDPEMYNKNIKCLLAFTEDTDGKEILLFQNSTNSKMLEPNRVLRRKRDGHSIIDTKGILLDNELAAVYFREDKKLLFKSYHFVKSFLPLDAEFEEATEKDITRILSHEIFECPDKNLIAHRCSKDRTLIRYFSKVKDSGILNMINKTDISKIINEGKKQKINVSINNDKIVVPNTDEDIMNLLILINQDFHIPYITGDPNVIIQRRSIN